jgi:hypothetical protein
MSIQTLKQSLPELSDAAYEKVYRQFFLISVATVLGYESRALRGSHRETGRRSTIVSRPSLSVVMRDKKGREHE